MEIRTVTVVTTADDRHIYDSRKSSPSQYLRTAIGLFMGCESFCHAMYSSDWISRETDMTYDDLQE